MRQILLSDYYPDFYENDFKGEEEKKAKQGVLVVVIILIGVLLFPCLLYIRQCVKYAKLSYKINILRVSEAKLENENAMLQAKKEQLSSLQRIEEIARNKLDLISYNESAIHIREQGK